MGRLKALSTVYVKWTSPYFYNICSYHCMIKLDNVGVYDKNKMKMRYAIEVKADGY